MTKLNALSANEIYLLYRDAYPPKGQNGGQATTNRSGFSLGNYGYNPGNMIAEAGSYSNASSANLDPRQGGGTTPGLHFDILGRG